MFKKGYVTQTEFNKVLNELLNIKNSFNEVSKKLDAVMKIQDFILNELPISKPESSPKLTDNITSPEMRLRLNN